jgi:Thymidylate synthase
MTHIGGIMETSNGLTWMWPNLVHRVINSGKPASPRNLDTIEVENVELEYLTPSYVFNNRIRRLNPVFHLVELMYFMDGRSDDLLSRYVKKMDDFINPDTQRFDGSYGPALHHGMPWISWALTSESSTRRAVLPILNKEHVVRPFSKDYPCNILFGFRIRDNKLNMNVVTRSQDLYRGFLYDTLEFQLLQTLMSSLFKVGVGTYHHTIFSLHLYSQDIEAAQKAARLMPSTLDRELTEMKPEIPEFDSWNRLWKWCHERCRFAEMVLDGPELLEGTLPDDDIANALTAFVARQNILPIGPYSNWVNQWLE